MTTTRTSALLAGAALTWVVAQAVEPDQGFADAVRISHVAAARTAEATAGVLFLLTAVLLVLAALSASAAATAGAAAGRRGGRSAVVGTSLTGLGGLWLAAGRGVFDVSFAGVTAAGVPRAAAIGLLDHTDESLAATTYAATLLCLLVGPVVAGTGVLRGRWLGRASVAPLALWVLGIVAFVAIEFRTAWDWPPLLLSGLGLTLLGVALDRRDAPTGAPSPAGARDRVEAGA